jgi:hypothetical protein
MRIWKNIPYNFSNCLTCEQAGARLGIFVKAKDVFHVSIRINSADELLQFVESFLVPLVMCSEDEGRNFTLLVYSILLNVGKRVLKTMETP